MFSLFTLKFRSAFVLLEVSGKIVIEEKPTNPLAQDKAEYEKRFIKKDSTFIQVINLSTVYSHLNFDSNFLMASSIAGTLFLNVAHCSTGKLIPEKDIINTHYQNKSFGNRKRYEALNQPKANSFCNVCTFMACREKYREWISTQNIRMRSRTIIRRPMQMMKWISKTREEMQSSFTVANLDATFG